MGEHGQALITRQCEAPVPSVGAPGNSYRAVEDTGPRATQSPKSHLIAVLFLRWIDLRNRSARAAIRLIAAGKINDLEHRTGRRSRRHHWQPVRCSSARSSVESMGLFADAT